MSTRLFIALSISLAYLAPNCFGEETFKSRSLSSTTTAASNVKTTFSATAKPITLTASVSASAATVNEGTVTFLITRDGNNVGTAVTATVANGVASVSYVLPGGSAIDDGYSIQATYSGTSNFASSSNNADLTVTAIAPAITSALSASGVAGVPFSYTIQATGSTPITYKAEPMPAGLSLTGAVISGTPTTVGATNVKITAINSGGYQSRTLTITINPGGAPSITSPLAATGTLGTPFTYIITATGGAPITFGATGLPSGLAFDVPSATISGTPAAIGIFPITLTAVNISGSDTQILSLTLNPSGAPTITSPLSEYTQVGLPFSYTITASGAGPITFDASNLPAWLTFSNGVLSGTPASGDIGISQPSLTASNANGSDVEQLTITVAPTITDPPVVTDITPSRNPVRTNTDVSFTVEAVAPSGQPLTFSWFFFFNGAQDGPPLAGDTVSRTFTQAGSYTVVAIAFDGFSKSASFMKIAVTLDPNSGATAPNLVTGQTAMNPVANFGISVPESLGGVVNLDLRNGNPNPLATFSTRLPGVAATFDGAALADKFSTAQIFVVESVMSVPGEIDQKARIMVPVSAAEAGAAAPVDDRTTTGLTDLAMNGKFGFGATLDTFTLNGTFDIPSGIKLSDGLSFWIGMSNVTTSAFMTSKGEVRGLKAPFKKIQFRLPKVDKTTGMTMKSGTAKVYLSMRGADLSAMGFDTDGITRLPTKTTAPRNMQFAMVLGGIPYYMQAQVKFSYDPNTDFGTVSGR
ncbi:MAG TPA: putative Ig domain-containing protein [Planctomycetota bacterium]|nr:putative Ig domain-containing protein [Planctomycetota bacterium]